jgi:hypothetical protein
MVPLRVQKKYLTRRKSKNMIKISQTISNTKRVSQIVSILYKNGFDDIIKKINLREASGFLSFKSNLS